MTHFDLALPGLDQDLPGLDTDAPQYDIFQDWDVLNEFALLGQQLGGQHTPAEEPPSVDSCPVGADNDDLDHVLESTPMSHTASSTPYFPSPPVTTPSDTAGARPGFPQSAVRLLRQWMASNSHYPYPTREDKEMLSTMTGLSQTQIINWFANARRRAKMAAPLRAPASSTEALPAMDIPARRATPGILEGMNPMQRWENSPPDNEPADVAAILGAVKAARIPASPSDRSCLTPASRHSDDSSSVGFSNGSSFGRYDAQSSEGSVRSARSSQGGVSLSPFPDSHSARRRRRRKRAGLPTHTTYPAAARGSFQCTFCAEDFQTKYDWQRHEKTWHLSIDRWVCAPTGPLAVHPVTGSLTCVFCSQPNPDAAHFESHNFSLCSSRTLTERTFYRKDHLTQHVRLGHHAKVPKETLETWKAASPEIRSRCGFCNITLHSWSARVDHLAIHFKNGATMEHWTGDWGFDEAVLRTVENSIPPYLIHLEKISPLPYVASSVSPWTPNSPYELLNMELEYWIANHTDDTGRPPTDTEIQLEACRIIRSADILSTDTTTAKSWLRDLVMSCPKIARDAMFQSVRRQEENGMSTLRINGKDNIFQDCAFESELRQFTLSLPLGGKEVANWELQVEADRILRRTHQSSSSHTNKDNVLNWLLRLTYNSTDWLEDFRKRLFEAVGQSEEAREISPPSADPNALDTKAPGFESPMVLDPAQQQEPTKERHRAAAASLIRGFYDLNDANGYRRLARGLARFVASSMSDCNPNKHIPSDEEIQQQARWLEYGEGDPWNQTAADLPDWLERFKRDIGLLPRDTGPGLGLIKRKT
ncbi:homeobox and C2H2 transcription factor [Cordyceps fumosorosea ARSEF 2679]|uniref:Homeobox and C2H2 transcription factor n=1 Tax=Cordyceps fumosorosea (strain ARSEF 2679) TaxID=1081104 RepID=A0A168ETK6_CORFA|nr:homeobox and C2H2 transcription factor [Cordyceps fumosorosea ARSEF 2679]OAA74203.1 homeobox and C2H2 transcription factor [Cordyceps fumosorosea ARSEF 2679]